MSSGSVFPIIGQSSDSSPISRSLFGRPTKTSYKLAVSKVIRDVKSAHNLTNIGLAEVLACDEKTIRSAESGDNGALDAVTLMNISYAFGESAISPVRNLYLCSAPEPETTAEKRKRLIRELAALEDE
jgi:predicted transcriptional regulator